jgi:hypothetical protein
VRQGVNQEVRLKARKVRVMSAKAKAGLSPNARTSAAQMPSWLPIEAIQSIVVGHWLSPRWALSAPSLLPLDLGTPYTLEAAPLGVCFLQVQCDHLQFRGPGGGRPRP